MRFGAMDGSLGRGDGPLESVFTRAREAGLDGVELCLRANYTQDPLWQPDGARTARQAATTQGIDVPSLCLLMLNQGNFVTGGETQAQARQIVARSIDVAHDVGARTILLPFFGAGKIADEAGHGRVVEDLRKLAPAAEAAGVTLGIETTLPAPDVLETLRLVDSPAVRCYFDIANAVWLGYDPVAELEALHAAGTMAQVHVKDIAENPGDRAPGEGRVPYPAVAAALRRSGYDGYLMFETRPTDDPVGAARRHRAYVSELLALPSSS